MEEFKPVTNEMKSDYYDETKIELFRFFGLARSDAIVKIHNFTISFSDKDTFLLDASMNYIKLVVLE